MTWTRVLFLQSDKCLLGNFGTSTFFLVLIYSHRVVIKREKSCTQSFWGPQRKDMLKPNTQKRKQWLGRYARLGAQSYTCFALVQHCGKRVVKHLSAGNMGQTAAPMQPSAAPDLCRLNISRALQRCAEGVTRWWWGKQWGAVIQDGHSAKF